MITIRRVYEEKTDGSQYVVLVDRLWPRGISKINSAWDEWSKEIAPSENLRKWFSHDVDKWDEFRKLYLEELSEKPKMLVRLKQLEKKFGAITLVYAARDVNHNNAVVLKELLSGMQL